ncbi:class I SAM-dependent methyltransferase [Hymenobacter guriensis]|uniref:Class I SAM-dependent methyltransferase n=1 Tax=Hymenobacter guriensis TaxID=2793065 RepID=A0ABS0L2C7_9BACT|nr:class I SAM-dependent methyltransferase [Hymenobacter guriensis]MBG8553738.1 class I SAM-dependent methyltransferase [Hymenobacter guriensis]
MPWLTTDDFLETLAKLRQRGLPFLLSKLVPSNLARTRSAFDDPALQAANWWQVPAVRRRWNEKISGDAAMPYEAYVASRYLAGRTGLRLLSLGSGACSHELVFARQPHFALVHCLDIAERLLAQAAATAQAEGLQNFQTEVADVNRLNLVPASYDVVLFHSALHHFRDVEGIVARVRQALVPGGLLVLNDYVGPACLQWTPRQLRAANAALGEVLPARYRQRFLSSQIKRHVSGPGRLRMYLADPSEAVESDRIVPALRRHFTPLEEAGLGGNLLTLVLKDIAHHFLAEDPTTQALLMALFQREDELLLQEPSNLLFGVYRPLMP